MGRRPTARTNLDPTSKTQIELLSGRLSWRLRTLRFKKQPGQGFAAPRSKV